ncbi:DUF2663 family protein [Bacillus sp. VT-16-64]|uniref:DUF2663 family protein n=1 Tax=Siminovitchia sp. FSL W7-1587 TaxID=2954699 RepID=UPI00209ABE2E
MTMEMIFQKLDNQTDQATKKMIQNLIERKLKFDRYKNIHFFLLTIACLYCLAIGYVCYEYFIIPHDLSAIEAVSAIMGTAYFAYLFIIGALLFGSVKIFYERKEKAEKEYQELRCEIIDKSKDLWHEDSWGDRYQVFEQIKRQYDINLFHESK